MQVPVFIFPGGSKQKDPAQKKHSHRRRHRNRYRSHRREGRRRPHRGHHPVGRHGQKAEKQSRQTATQQSVPSPGQPIIFSRQPIFRQYTPYLAMYRHTAPAKSGAQQKSQPRPLGHTAGHCHTATTHLPKGSIQGRKSPLAPYKRKGIRHYTGKARGI